MAVPEYPLNLRAPRPPSTDFRPSPWNWFELSSILGTMLLLSAAALDPLSTSTSVAAPGELLRALPLSLAALAALLSLAWLTRHFVSWFWRKRARQTWVLALAMGSAPLLSAMMMLRAQVAQEQAGVPSTLMVATLMLWATCFATWRAARLIPGQPAPRPPRNLSVTVVGVVAALSSMSLLVAILGVFRLA